MFLIVKWINDTHYKLKDAVLSHNQTGLPMDIQQITHVLIHYQDHAIFVELTAYLNYIYIEINIFFQ